MKENRKETTTQLHHRNQYCKLNKKEENNKKKIETNIIIIFIITSTIHWTNNHRRPLSPVHHRNRLLLCYLLCVTFMFVLFFSVLHSSFLFAETSNLKVISFIVMLTYWKFNCLGPVTLHWVGQLAQPFQFLCVPAP